MRGSVARELRERGEDGVVGLIVAGREIILVGLGSGASGLARGLAVRPEAIIGIERDPPLNPRSASRPAPSPPAMRIARANASACSVSPMAETKPWPCRLEKSVVSAGSKAQRRSNPQTSISWEAR
jgi:hypothetical protein